jgi:hypothetical protein
MTPEAKENVDTWHPPFLGRYKKNCPKKDTKFYWFRNIFYRDNKWLNGNKNRPSQKSFILNR